jgi:23S rRNA pseudouridine1911/1915/1917 synthase
MVIAKTELAQAALAKEFFEKTIERKYIALAWGDFAENAGTIRGNIGRHKKNRQVMDVYVEDENGKPAVTHYKVLERFGYVTLIECKLETGRTHQIRVHFQHIGHPLFNDEQYGGNKILKGTTFAKYRQFVENCFALLPRQALHAKTLGFMHPQSGKRIFFDSALPPDMAVVIQKWEQYTAGRGKS